MADGDIIVTARRVEERLQDVPISITVFNQKQIDERNVASVSDLAAYTPSLTANNRFGSDYASFAIRGFTQEQRTTASVATYFADVVSPRAPATGGAGDGAGPGSFFDLQNVQVLKGPQGTLFGRNTTGGAVLLVPKKPSHRLEGYGEASAGNYNMRRLQGVLNLPVNDSLRIRAGVDWQERDGVFKNISSIGPDDFGDVDYVAARLSVVADLTPTLENYTIASYANSTRHGTIGKVTDCFGDTFFPFGALACQQIAREKAAGFFTVSSWLPDAHQSMRRWQIINTTTWTASDSLTVKNIASYAELKQHQQSDLFGLAALLPATITNFSGTTSITTGPYAGLSTGISSSISPPGGNTVDQSSFTEELQVQGRSINDRFIWQAGVYFEESKPLGPSGTQSTPQLVCTDSGRFECTDVLGAITATLPVGQRRQGAINYQVGTTRYRNVGIYGQGSFDLTERLKFTAGIRYTWDRTRSAADKVTYRFPAPNAPVGICRNVQVRPASQPITHPAQCREYYEQNSEAPTWLIGLDYKPSEDVLLYSKYARGYRQGSTNPFSAEGYNTFEPERVDTYEIGAKTTFRGSVPGNFNISAFYNDFRDQQLQIGFLSSTSGISPNVAIINAGKSRIYGAEVEASVMPFHGFTLQGSYAYLNTKLQSVIPIEIVPGSLFDIPIAPPSVGGELPLTPKHKLSLDAQYTLPLDLAIGTVRFGATYVYTGRAFNQTVSVTNLAKIGSPEHVSIIPAQGDIESIPAYSLVNLTANWSDVAQSNIDIQAFVTNIFDKRYFESINTSSISQGFISRFVGPPRMYGMRVRYSF